MMIRSQLILICSFVYWISEGYNAFADEIKSLRGRQPSSAQRNLGDYQGVSYYHSRPDVFTHISYNIVAIKKSFFTSTCINESDPYRCNLHSGGIGSFAPHYTIKTHDGKFLRMASGGGQGGIEATSHQGLDTRWYFVDFGPDNATNNRFGIINAATYHHLGATWQHNLSRDWNYGLWQMWYLDEVTGKKWRFRNAETLHFGNVHAHSNGHMDWQRTQDDRTSFSIQLSSRIVYEAHHTIMGLCSNGTTEVTTKYIGEPCGKAMDKIFWHSMQTINPSNGMTSTQCSWSRDDWQHHQEWLESWVGFGCGDSPSQLNLPTTVNGAS